MIFFLWLTERIVRHRSTAPGCYRLKSRKELWKRIEPEKSLFKVPGGKGLPIGNLTSQFFANVYKHPLDVFLAKSRKGKFLYWQRYVDDVLIFGTDAKVLSAFAKEIDDFVQENLKLRLNPKKTFLQPLCHGVDHLGYFIKPSHTTIRRSVMRRAEARMRHPYLIKAPLQAADFSQRLARGVRRFDQLHHFKNMCVGWLAGGHPRLGHFVHF